MSYSHANDISTRRPDQRMGSYRSLLPRIAVSMRAAMEAQLVATGRAMARLRTSLDVLWFTAATVAAVGLPARFSLRRRQGHADRGLADSRLTFVELKESGVDHRAVQACLAEIFGGRPESSFQ